MSIYKSKRLRTRLSCLAAAVSAVVAVNANADIIITGVIDGPYSGGYPKAVEVYATTDIAAGAGYGLYREANSNTDGGTLDFTFEDALVAGEYYWIANDGGFEFESFFGFTADYYDGSVQGNGDDRYLIKQGDVIVDVFGELGVDGSGTAWEYTDGWAYRQSTSSGPNFGNFDASNWDFSGPNALDGTTVNTTMPVAGVYPDDGGGDDDLTIGQCGDEATLISAVQGNGAAVTTTDDVVVEAIVTRDLQGDGSDYQFSGFWVQEEDADSDGDATTSEGIFVYNYWDDVNVGDKVRLLGGPSEYNGVSQIGAPEVLICSTGNALPAKAALAFPLDSLDTLEAVEGMLVEVATPMVVSDFYVNNYSFENYGEFLVSTRLHFQPTALATPAAGLYEAAEEALVLDSIIISDYGTASRPSYIPFPTDAGFSNTNYFRIGYGVTNIEGVVHGYDSGSTKLPYSIVPNFAPTFDPAGNDRTLEPYVDPAENLVIASMNVLNLFNGVVDAEGNILFPEDGDAFDEIDQGRHRGAYSAFDYDIQLGKIVSALVAMDADIVGLMEIENDGFDQHSTILDLVEALNAELPESEAYAFVDAGGPIGSDAIAVGMLYKVAALTPKGTTAILDSSNSALDDNGDPLFIDSKNRPSLIQSFLHKESHQFVTVSVNHLKSKGSDCEDVDDPDLGDGSGNCNLTRQKAAEALALYLETDPTGIQTKNVVIMGDINAYAKETPIVALQDAGYVNLKATDVSTEEIPFSYSFSGLLGSLDYVMTTEKMAKAALSADAWHINSVESPHFDYESYYDPIVGEIDPYYSSDHDPIVAAFYLQPKRHSHAHGHTSMSGFWAWFGK